MRRRPYQRRRQSKGFALAEALVSLSVAAVTLALLTGATWGLRQAAPTAGDLQQGADDWLTARRVLQAWSSSATTTGLRGVEGRFAGDATQMRLVIDDASGRRIKPHMVSFDIRKEGEQYHLVAAQHDDVVDTRIEIDRPRESTVIISNRPLRLIYLTPRLDALGQVWSYDPQPQQGLPSAIAIEMGDERMIMARLPATRSASCVAGLGQSGLQERACRLR